MKKLKKGRKLGREKNQRKALKRSLARALFLEGRIKTTEAKAKELKSFAEKIITRAKKGGVSSNRELAKHFSKEIVSKLTGQIAPKYKNRQGGYTRVIKLGPRKSDGAKMVFIELV